MSGANHILTGALIGALIQEPLIALPVALLSHFALDLLPHFGFSSWEERQKHKNLHKIILRVDLLMLLVVVLLILSAGAGWLVIACAFAAVAPDLAWVYRYIFQQQFGRLKPRKGNWLTEFHSGIQTREFPNGFIIEIIAFAGLVTMFNRWV